MYVQVASPIAWSAQLHGASLVTPHKIAQDWPPQARSTTSRSIVPDDGLRQRVLRAISRQSLSYDESEAPARPPPPPDRLRFHPAAAATLDDPAASYGPQDDQQQQMTQQQLQRQAYDNYHRQMFGWPNKNLKPVHVSISQATVNGLLSLLLLFVIAIYGSIGSIFLMSALTVVESLQTRGNCYLASLALSHLTVTLFVIPSSALQIVAGGDSGSASGPGQSGSSNLGSQAVAINLQQLCHYQWLVLEFSFLVSQLSFMLIAADNYLSHLCSERVVASVATFQRQGQNHDQVQAADNKTAASRLKPLGGGARPSATSPAPPPAGQSQHQAALSLQAEFLAQSTRHKLTSTTSFDSNPIRALLSCRFGCCYSSVARSGSCCLAGWWRLVARAARGLFLMWRLGATTTSTPSTRQAATLDHDQPHRLHHQHLVSSAKPASGTSARYNNSSKALEHKHDHSSRGRLASQFARETNSRVKRPNGCFNYRFCCGRLKVVMWICVAWALALVYVIHKHELSFGARFCATGPAPPTGQSHSGSSNMKAAHAKQQLAPTQHLARPPPDRVIDQRPVMLNSLSAAGENMREIPRASTIESHHQQVGNERVRPPAQRELTATVLVDGAQRSRQRRRDSSARQSSRVANQLAGWLSIGVRELAAAKLSPPESRPTRSNPIMMDLYSLTGSQLDAFDSASPKPSARDAQAEATKVAPAQQAGPPLRSGAAAISRARLGTPGGTRLKLSNAIARIIRLPAARPAGKSNQSQNKVEVEHEAASPTAQVDRAEAANLYSAKLPFTASQSKRAGASNNDGERFDYAECQERHGSNGDKNVSLDASPSDGRPSPPPATTTRPIIMDDGRRPGDRVVSSGDVTTTTTWKFRRSRFGAGGHDNKDEPLASSSPSTASDSRSEGDEQAAGVSSWLSLRPLPLIGSAAFHSSDDVDDSDQGRRLGPLDTRPSSSLVAPRRALDESNAPPTGRHIDGLASSWSRSRALPATASFRDAAASVGRLSAATDKKLERERTMTTELVRLPRRFGQALEATELEAHSKGLLVGRRDSTPSSSWLEGMTKLEKQTSGDDRLKDATRTKTNGDQTGATPSQGQLLVDGATGNTSRDSSRRLRRRALIAGVQQTTRRITTQKGLPPEPLDVQSRDGNEIEADKKIERPSEHKRTRGTSTSRSSDHHDKSSAQTLFVGHERDSCHRNKLQTNGSSGWEATSELRARGSALAAHEVEARSDLDPGWPTKELDDKLGRAPAHLHRGPFALAGRFIEDKRPPTATRTGDSDPASCSGPCGSVRTVDLTESPGELPSSKSITSRQLEGLEGAPSATPSSLNSRADGVELTLAETQLVQQKPPPLMNNNNTNNLPDRGIDSPLRLDASLGSSQRMVSLRVADRLMPTAGLLAHFDINPVEAQQQLNKVRLLAKHSRTLDVDLNAAAVQQRRQALPRTIRAQVENLQQQPPSPQQRQQPNNKTHSSWPLFAAAVLLPSLISGLLFARAYVQMRKFKTRPYKPMPAATLASTPPALLTPHSPIPIIVQRQVYAFDRNAKTPPPALSYEFGCGAPSESVASSSFSAAVLLTNNNSESYSSSASSSSSSSSSSLSSSSSSDCHCQTEIYDDQNQEEEDAGESLARAAQATVRRVSEITNDLQASSSSRASSFRRNTADNKNQPKLQKQQQSDPQAHAAVHRQPHAHHMQLNQVMSAPPVTYSGRTSPAHDYHKTGPIIDRYVNATLQDGGLNTANLPTLLPSSIHFNPSPAAPKPMQQHHQQPVMNQKTTTAIQVNHQLQHQQLTGTQLTNSQNGARPNEWLNYTNLHHRQQQHQRRRPQRQPSVSYSAPPSATLLSNSGRGESIQQQQSTTSRTFLTNYLVEGGDFETSHGQPLQVQDMNSEPRDKCQRHSSPITYQNQWQSTPGGSATVQPAEDPQVPIAYHFQRHQHHAQSFHYGTNTSAYFQDHRQQQQCHSMRRRAMNAHFSQQAANLPGSDLNYQDFAARYPEIATTTNRKSSQSNNEAKSRALANVIRSVDTDSVLVAASSSVAAVAPNDADVPPSPPLAPQQRTQSGPAEPLAISAGSRRRGTTPKPLEMSAIRNLASESTELASNGKTANKNQHNETNNKVILCTYSYMTDDQLLKSNMIVFVVHSTFWLPFVVLLMMTELGSEGDELVSSSTTTTTSSSATDYRDLVWWLATLNCCTCPYLYALSNKDFREAFNKLFYYCCCKSHVTFARKTPIFRRQLDVDSEGNLRVHIIPGLNSYSNKLFNGSGGCSMGLGNDLGVLGPANHNHAASSLHPPHRHHHATSSVRADPARPYSAEALAGQQQPSGGTEGGPSQQQPQAQPPNASNSSNNNDNNRHIRSCAMGKLGVGPLAPPPSTTTAATTTTTSTAAVMMIDSDHVTRVGSLKEPSAA